MPIKRRSNIPVYEEPQPQEKGPLVIVAKPKEPMPTDGVVEYFGDDSAQRRRIGLVALACGDQPDEQFNVTDRVALLRTPYDKKNLQERRYRNRVKNRATAITAMCIVCQGTRKAVTECIDTQCPLWAFRFGGDPFHGKRK